MIRFRFFHDANKLIKINADEHGSNGISLPARRLDNASSAMVAPGGVEQWQLVSLMS
jgi:hypothetical protein